MKIDHDDDGDDDDCGWITSRLLYSCQVLSHWQAERKLRKVLHAAVLASKLPRSDLQHVAGLKMDAATAAADPLNHWHIV